MTVRRHNGFTLVEMLCASGISLLAVTGIVAMFVTHAHSYTNHKLIRQMQQNARFAMDSVTRDLHMAGYGLAIRDSELPLWVSWVSNMTANPLLVQGASSADTDTLVIAAAFDPPVTELLSGAGADAVTLTLKNGGGAYFDTSTHSLLFIGRTETARVVNKSGDLLTISTHPTAVNRGLRFSHPAGSPVERVDVVTYRCATAVALFQQETFMVRDTGSALLPDWQKMLAGHIEDFQVAPAGYGTWVSLTARTPETLAKSRRDPTDDGYLRTTLTSRVIPRNDTAFGLRN